MKWPEEETRRIQIVGNYSMPQAGVEDCVRCHNAKFATVIVDGLCLDCWSKKIIENELNELEKL